MSDVEISENELGDMVLQRNKTVHGDTGWYGCGHDDGDDDGENSIRWIYVYVKCMYLIYQKIKLFIILYIHKYFIYFFCLII